MLNDHWPLRRLRLTTERLVLRLPTEEELAELADVAAAGVHEPGERPFLTAWTEQPPAERARYVLQHYWSGLGSWEQDSWELELGVFLDAVPVGMVGLRGQEFGVLREVKTHSWLGLPYHGKGLGTEARTALLQLAFEGLDAECAVTEVFQDNAASQGVSRKLGYKPDGISRDVLHGQVVVSDRLRLSRDDWRQLDHCKVQVEGLEDCRDWFIA